MKRLTPITARQQAVLVCIAVACEQTGRPPTFREIGERLGIASVNAVTGHVHALLAKGALVAVGEGNRRYSPRPSVAIEATAGENGQVQLRFPGRLVIHLSQAEAARLEADLLAARAGKCA